MKNNAESWKKTCRKTTERNAYQLVKELTSLKQGSTTTIQDKAGKCLTEGQDILKRCQSAAPELHAHTTTGDPKMLDIPPPINNDSYPILLEEVKAAVNARKKGKSVGVGNIPQELVRQERPRQICYSSCAIRSDEQENGQHLGHSP